MRFSCIANSIASRIYGSSAKYSIETNLCEVFLHIVINTFVGDKPSFLEFTIHDRYIDIIAVNNVDFSKVLEVLDDYSKLKMVRFKEGDIHTELKETLEEHGLVKIHDYRYAVVPETWSIERALCEYDLDGLYRSKCDN